MTDRKQVTEYTSVIRGSWSLEDISEVIHKLKHLRSQGYSKVELDEEYSDRWSQETTLVLKAIKYRKENDQERKKRVEEEEKMRETRRKTYELLRKEFDTSWE
jgi:hypothetical protein